MPVKLSSGSGDAEEEARIEIVPLIDIMFFLLASFMLVSLSMSKVNRVPVTVPRSTTAKVEVKMPPIHIAVDKHGVITWDKEVMTPTEVTEKLFSISTAKESGVFIAADEETAHRDVMKVLDAVRSAKIDKAGFESRKADK